MSDKRLLLTKEQAKDLLKEGELIHTFMQSGPCMIGADWDKAEAIKEIDKAVCIEASGDMARGMKHGLCIWRDVGNDNARPIFIEHDEAKLVALEAQ